MTTHSLPRVVPARGLECPVAYAASGITRDGKIESCILINADDPLAGQWYPDPMMMWIPGFTVILCLILGTLLILFLDRGNPGQG